MQNDMESIAYESSCRIYVMMSICAVSEVGAQSNLPLIIGVPVGLACLIVISVLIVCYM